MIAGAGGAMRATEWRATAIRFQQFGEGALMASLAERTVSPWTATSMRDRPAGARPAPTACAALCVAMDRSPAADVDGWCRSDGGEDSAPRRR